MTPLGPNGQNGGAGIVATSLVRHLSALAPDFQLTLLTSHESHNELASLDAVNVRRQCVVPSPNVRSVSRRIAARLLPPHLRMRMRHVYWSLRTRGHYARLTEDLQPDLLLCPFTVPYFWRQGVPCVSVVYDLQHATYPEFFSAEQRLNRRLQIEDACTRSARLVCISEYVRSTLLATVDVRAERVVTIPLGLLREDHGADTGVVGRLGVTSGRFLLYPANFWPHKNHLRLLEALRMNRQAHPDSHLKLVCTGAPNALMRTLETAAAELLPPGVVVFAGYVRDEELSALFDACAGVVFPSLYEGFGMPVLEAMARGKPVLCSNVTSLPEVSADAAIYFDPRDPRQIASAIDALGNRGRIADLVCKGQQRAAALGTGREMAAQYLAVLQGVMASSDA
jgi:glycosyltransferase involved in cell wall biosynthesis